MKRSEPGPAAGGGADQVVRAHVHVSGRVQGVGFRYFTLLEAETLGLSGWVRNLVDGRVEFVAQGPRDAVDALIATVKVGPDLAHVRDVAIAWEPAGPDLATGEFGVRR